MALKRCLKSLEWIFGGPITNIYKLLKIPVNKDNLSISNWNINNSPTELMTTIDIKFTENDAGRTCFSSLSSALHYMDEIYTANKVQLLGNKIERNPSIELISATIKKINSIHVKGKLVGNGIELSKRHLLYENRYELCASTHYIIMLVLWSKGKSCKRAITLIDDIIFDPIQSQAMKRTQKTITWLLNDTWKIVSIYSFHHGAKKRNSNINWM
jgi:hypothetical protein